MFCLIFNTFNIFNLLCLIRILHCIQYRKILFYELGKLFSTLPVTYIKYHKGILIENQLAERIKSTTFTQQFYRTILYFIQWCVYKQIRIYYVMFSCVIIFSYYFLSKTKCLTLKIQSWSLKGGTKTIGAKINHICTNKI